MKTENLKKLIEYSEKGIISKEILKNNKINVTLFCMGKGTEISEHTSTREGLVWAIEGEGFFNFENESIEIKEGVLIHLKESIKHSLKADKDTSFLLILF